MTWRALTPGILALAVVGAWLGLRPSPADPQEAAPERGRAHVEKTCAGCHPGAGLDAVARRRIAQGPGALDAFLASHYVADAALRADVVAYLQKRVATESAARLGTKIR